jgi:hypothetical protein
MNKNIYSDQDIIDRALEYNRLVHLRTADISLYHLIRRRELLDRIRELMLEKPRKKRIKNGTRVLRIPTPRIKRGPIEKRAKREPKNTRQKEGSCKFLYKAIKIEGQPTICGRCLINEPRAKRSHLCKPCYRVYTNCQREEDEHVPHNIKQKFCNTKITHYEKTFLIGIKADEKLQAYLTAVGYGFIFQEPWQDIWDWHVVME